MRASRQGEDEGASATTVATEQLPVYERSIIAERIGIGIALNDYLMRR